MAYQKHTWVTKEIIKADNLNHIEDGIYQEERRASQAEELISQSVTNEVTRATNAESALGNRVTATESAITTLNGNDQVVGSVDYKIAHATVSAGGYKVVVDHTLVGDPSDKYIYLEPDNTVTGTDKFREWIWTDYDVPGTFSWKCTGDVSLDLSDYIQNTDVATTSAVGVVKVDGTSITVTNDGTISAAPQQTGVSSFNGRTGTVLPQNGDYTASDVGLGNVGNFKAVSTVASQGLSSTEQSNARDNIGAGTSNFDGAYSSLSGTPTLGTSSSLNVASSGDASSSEVVKGDDSRLTDARTPVSHTHTTSDISNFPTLGTASALDVATSGDAGSTEVVKGDDSRLSDARTPTSHTHTSSQITDFPTLGTAASLDVPTSGDASSTEVVKGDDSRLTDSRTPTSHTHTTSDISNFPTLGTAASLDVATSGDASTTQVVKGDDSRLTDSRTPTTHSHTVSQISDFPTLGSAASLDVASTGDASTTEVVKGDDSRLTDARTPTSHTHTVSDITNLPTIPGGVKIGTTRAGATDTTLYFIRS